LSEDVQEKVRQSLLSINLDVFLALLHECIILQLTVQENDSDADFDPENTTSYGLIPLLTSLFNVVWLVVRVILIIVVCVV